MLFEIILNCFFLWMTFDFLNQVMNANALRAFHRRIGNTGDVEINVLVIHRKVELIRIITIFEMTIFLHFVQSSLNRLPRFIVTFQDAFFFLSIGLPRSIGRTKFSLQLTNNLLGEEVVSIARERVMKLEAAMAAVGESDPLSHICRRR